MKIKAFYLNTFFYLYYLGLACGGEVNSGVFVVAYLHNGEIYQWGSLPRRSNSNSITTPQRLNIGFNLKVTSIACGYSHCLILTDDGKVMNVLLNTRLNNLSRSLSLILFLIFLGFQLGF